MEDNEVELKDAKPGMWATFDVPELIDNSYVHVEPGHYEGAILEPTEGHLLEEMVFSIFYGHDVVRLCIDGSTVGLEKGKPYTFVVIKDKEPFMGALTNVHVYKTKPANAEPADAEPGSYEDIPCDKPGFYLDEDGNAWCVDNAGNAWLFTDDKVCILYRSNGDSYWHGPFRKAKLVAA